MSGPSPPEVRSGTIPSVGDDPQGRRALILAQLNKMLASPEFRQSERMRRFLTFVVECSLRGETDRLKESVIGVEVFDRPADYDPKTEPIVRTEARRLREKIRKYYEVEGPQGAVTISLPKGGYTPMFEFRPAEASRNPEKVISLPGPVLVMREPAARSRKALWASASIAAACCAGALLVWPGRTPAPTPTLSPLTSFPGTAFRPSLSPDGQRVAFVWDGGSGNFDIYVKQVNIGNPLRLTTNPAQDLDPTWSPDGRQIAFLRRSPERQELLVIPAMGGAERKIAEISATQAPWSADGARFQRRLGPSWSPDGRQIAVADAPAPGAPDSIYLFNSENGERRRLTTPARPDEADSEPVFSFRGDLVAFVRWRSGAGGSPAIYVQPLKGGEARQITFDHRQIEGIAWAAGDRRIIFSSDRDNEYILWQVALSGGPPVPLGGVGLRAQHPSLSADGHRLAFTENFYSTNILRAPLDRTAAGGPAPFLSSSRTDDSPQYSPDGKRVLFISSRSGPSQIWLCDADGANAGPLGALKNVQPGTPRWSPDGAQIVFDSRHEGFGAIYAISADGARLRRLTPENSSSMMASWSSDGKWIYYASDRSGRWEIWKQPMPVGSPVQVTRQGGREAKESRDGRVLYYTNDDATGPGRLWQVPVEGGTETPVAGLEAINLGRQWALADGGIYYVSRTPALAMVFFDLATRRTSRLFALANRPALGTSGPTVSPDGRWILYSQVDREGSNVMLLQNF